MMVKYKIVNTGQLVEVGGGYAEHGGDILETKTNQIVKSGVRMSIAKGILNHLNLGGGFNGETPSFFLKNIPCEASASYK